VGAERDGRGFGMGFLGRPGGSRGVFFQGIGFVFGIEGFIKQTECWALMLPLVIDASGIRC
jgi:hypothetical protein